MKTDVLIVGAGPAGIFTALEMLRKGSKKKIMIVEKGAAIEKRHCPKVKTGA
ncbi:MAG: FAD-dependent oxidoreductase, partial [Clostridiales bacterium]|nr:FAD-dependent oxidoreductase [Clostridiales bacterium]